MSFLPQVTPPATHFFPELQPRPQVTTAGTIWTLGLKCDHSHSWECRQENKDEFSKMRGVGVGEMAQGSVPSMYKMLTIVSGSSPIWLSTLPDCRWCTDINAGKALKHRTQK